MGTELKELREVERNINSLNDNFQRIKGKRTQIQSELKERGFKTIGEARAWIKKTTEELGKQSSYNTKRTVVIKQKIKELEDGLLSSESN